MNWQNEFNIEIRDRILALLWRQWAQLGLASGQVPHRDDWVVDPEALFLATCDIGRYDPRLFDEMLDWLTINAHFVNIPRAKSLKRRFSIGGDDRVLAAVFDTVTARNKRLNWRLKCDDIPVDAEPLFHFKDQENDASFGPKDPIFLQYGYFRGPVELRGYSRRFNTVMPECLILRLRALVGPTARAEILAYLITHKAAHPSGIARDTGFSQKSINDTLLDMEASGIVFSGQLQGRKKQYFVRKRDHRPFLHDPGNVPRWVCWPALWQALLELYRGVLDIDRLSPPPIVRAGELIKLTRKLQPCLQYAEFSHCFTETANIQGIPYIGAFQDAIQSLFAELDSRQDTNYESIEIADRN